MAIYYGKKTYKVIKNFIYCGETFYAGNLFDATQEDYERFKKCLENIDNHQKPELTGEEKQKKEEANAARVKKQKKEEAAKEKEEYEINCDKMSREELNKYALTLGIEKPEDYQDEKLKEEIEELLQTEEKEGKNPKGEKVKTVSYKITKEDDKQFPEYFKRHKLKVNKKMQIPEGSTIDEMILNETDQEGKPIGYNKNADNKDNK